VSFAQEQYYNEQFHFSLSIPNGWEYITYDELDDEQKEVINVASNHERVLLCLPEGADYFAPPFMRVRWSPTQDQSEQLFERIWTTPELMKAYKKKNEESIVHIQNAEGCIPDYWVDATYEGTDYNYDRAEHILTKIENLRKNGIGEIKIATLQILGNQRIVTVNFYLEGPQVEHVGEYLSEIKDSFYFDEGYGFGEDKGTNTSLTQKLLGNTWQGYLVWTIGVVIVYWLVRRKVYK